jgi:hypothetical protein
VNEQTTEPQAEIEAMAKVADAIGRLDSEAAGRVLRWAVERYAVAVSRVQRPAAATAPRTEVHGEPADFGDLAALYAAAAPESDADKALVVAYWAQYGDGKADFGTQEVNTALKNLGHPISKINRAFDNLKARKPAPVIQVKKSGSSKQGRKTYRLTVAGKQAVEAMAASGQVE